MNKTKTIKPANPKKVKAQIVYPVEQQVLLYLCQFEVLGVKQVFVTSRPSETTQHNATVIGTRSVIVREGTFDFPA